MKGLQLAAALSGLLLSSVPQIRADGTYRSRPDLVPLHLNITIPCAPGACEQGYLFVAPYTSSAAPDDRVPFQVAPYILTDTGELVWSGLGYFSGWTANFQAARYRGQDVLFAFEGRLNLQHGHGHGHHTLLDPHYEAVRVLRAGGHLLADIHEFEVVDEATALLLAFHPLQRGDLDRYGGKADQTWIVDGRFQEVDIATGKVLFEWHSLDHGVTPEESNFPLLGVFGHSSATAWDYLHINSVAKGRDGHYLVSARHSSTVYKISGIDGSVIWRLGGTRSDFALGEGVRFGFQHHARYFVDGGGHPGAKDVITLFDNGDLAESHSRGKYIELDHDAKTATLARVREPPSVALGGGDASGDPPIFAFSQGSIQSLPGTGGDLVNWGSAGQVTEYDAQGKPVFHAYLGRDFLRDQLQNYRAFKFNWTGRSSETPAVVAEEFVSPSAGSDSDAGTVRIFVSWNGDTLAKTWQFTWLEETATLISPRQTAIPRTGFETSVRVRRPRGVRIKAVRAEALDADGNVLVVSELVDVRQAVPRHIAEADAKKESAGAKGQIVLGTDSSFEL